jgi:hypothetical protein
VLTLPARRAQQIPATAFLKVMVLLAALAVTKLAQVVPATRTMEIALF